MVTATLEWDGGSEQRRKRGADLDLYALFVPASKAIRGDQAPGTLITPKKGSRPARASDTAHKGKGADVVYYKRLGSRKNSPFIHLDGDARVPGRETLRIVRPTSRATSCSAPTPRSATASAPSAASGRRSSSPTGAARPSRSRSSRTRRPGTGWPSPSSTSPRPTGRRSSTSRPTAPV
ncbi:hypothetical protein WKI71_21575 [Streptomyces sp. MS1.AVA.1]|uniref:Uncharacterized protein n=1 Tax=Streptomyces machairae TaxID=3134109 RepID=A0ABU8UPI7_9ACTN